GKVTIVINADFSDQVAGMMLSELTATKFDGVLHGPLPFLSLRLLQSKCDALVHATAVRVKSTRRQFKSSELQWARPPLQPQHPAAREPCGREDQEESGHALRPTCRHKFRDNRKMRPPRHAHCRQA